MLTNSTHNNHITTGVENNAHLDQLRVTIEYPKLERTPKDQRPSSGSTQHHPNPNPESESIAQTLLELQQLEAVLTDLGRT